MSKLSRLIIIMVVFVASSLPWLSASAIEDGLNVNLTVNTCNENGVCNSAVGETVANCPTDCSTTSSGPPSVAVSLAISDVVATPSTSTALIKFKTNLIAFSTLSWGLTTSYELGAIAETTSGLVHSISIPGLSPATKYFFKIESVEDGKPSNKASSLGNTFTTQALDTESPIANPSLFDATYRATTLDVLLTWVNPSSSDFDVVRIVRSTTFFPTDPTDGVIIYEGSEEIFTDTSVHADTTYYYTIFARDLSGSYSSGVVDSVFVPATDAIPDDTDEDPDKDSITGPDDELSSEETIFDTLPEATEVPPEIGKLKFIIKQNGKSTAFSDGAKVRLERSGNITVHIPYSSIPEVLKTIVVTMRHPKDKSKISSFLLSVNKDKTLFSATMSPLLDAGDYETTIYLLDHKYNRLISIKGTFIVSPINKIGLVGDKSIPERIAPIGAIVGVASGLVQTILITTNIGSAYDLYLILARLLGALLGLFGIRKRHRPWGTVYDSITKRPLDPAYVVVKQDGKQVADAITDLDGRYGFLLPGGSYTIVAGKTHYDFPSKILAEKDSDELYSNLYHGEALLNDEGEVVTRNIPLDPIGFDWNEFVKSKQALYRIYSRRDKIKTLIFDALYLLGFIFTIFATIASPGIYNYIVLGLYIILFIVQTFWRYTYRAVTIKDTNTGEPYAFAIVRVFLSALNQEVKRVVTDEFGRFYILVSPGRYYITVDAKRADGSYHRVYRSALMRLDRGILTQDILVGEIATPTQDRFSFVGSNHNRDMQ